MRLRVAFVICTFAFVADVRNVTASGKVIQNERHELASFEVK